MVSSAVNPLAHPPKRSGLWNLLDKNRFFFLNHPSISQEDLDLENQSSWPCISLNAPFPLFPSTAAKRNRGHMIILLSGISPMTLCPDPFRLLVKISPLRIKYFLVLFCMVSLLSHQCLMEFWWEFWKQLWVRKCHMGMMTWRHFTVSPDSTLETDTHMASALRVHGWNRPGKESPGAC